MKLTITHKLGSGFGIIILSVLINLYLTNLTGRKYQKLEKEIATMINPSREELKQLSDMVATSTILTKNWSFIEKNESDDKTALKKLHQADYPELCKKLKTHSQHWTESEQTTFSNIITAIENELFQKQRYIMEQLDDMEKYNDALVKFEVDPMLDETGEIPIITRDILTKMEHLIGNFNEQATTARHQINEDFTGFQRLIIITNIILIFIVLISAVYSYGSIVKPLKKIDALIGKLATGNLSEKLSIRQNDEIGVISASVNTMIDGLRSTHQILQIFRRIEFCQISQGVLYFFR